MRKISLFFLVFIAAAALAFMIPGAVCAKGEGGISTTVIDTGIFVTVKETAEGDVLTLYRISGDRILLVDTVINTSDRSSSDTSFPKRYLIHVDGENR